MRRHALAALLCLALAACAEDARKPVEAPPALADIAFQDLPGWAKADAAPALAAFKTVCRRFARKAKDAPASPAWAELGQAGDWAAACAAAQDVPAADAKAFVERRFQVFRVGGAETVGRFTGYFEPEFPASRTRSGPYQTPIHGKPDDIVEVDLGAFSDDLAGKTILGRLEGRRLKPYHERASIAEGALAGRGLELAWLADPVDAFFLEIQGSGRLRLPDGEIMRVGYAGKNGRPYRAIGRDLIERGAVPREKMSMQAIRTWLADNPAEAQAVMNLNRSYVFFIERDGPGPVGAAGTVLTPGHSLAVDPKFAPLGGLVYLDAPHPDADAPPLRRLVAAEDVGGAIKGAVRGDLFWGSGDAAGDLAGRMNGLGRYYLLAPKRGCASREAGEPC